MTEQKNEIQRLLVTSNDPISGMLWDTAKFEHLQRIAGMFAKSGMVPDMFRNNIAACAVGLQLAGSLQVSPFMLFQKMYVIGGKPSIEAQLAIAVANQRGVFTNPIEYTFTGSNKDRTRSCTASAVLTNSKKKVEMTIDWELVQGEGWDKKAGSKWKTMPDQMFRYRSAMWLIRTYCPEVLFGMYSSEELRDQEIIDVTPAKPEARQSMVNALNGEDITIGAKKSAEKQTETVIEKPSSVDVPPEPIKFFVCSDCYKLISTSHADKCSCGCEKLSAYETMKEAKAAIRECKKNAEKKVAAPEPETAQDEAVDTSTDNTPKQDEPFSVVKADEMIDQLIEEAGLNAENKKASLAVIMKTATGGKLREEWGQHEYGAVERTLKSIIKKNSDMAARKAAAAAKKEGK